MTRFVVGDVRSQSTLFAERLHNYLSEDTPVPAVAVLVDELALAGLGFGEAAPLISRPSRLGTRGHGDAFD